MAPVGGRRRRDGAALFRQHLFRSGEETLTCGEGDVQDHAQADDRGNTSKVFKRRTGFAFHLYLRSHAISRLGQPNTNGWFFIYFVD